MIIGISINNIIRDHLTQLELVYNLRYNKVPIYPINPFDLEKSFPTVETSEAIEEFNLDNNDDIVFSLNDNTDEEFNVLNLMYSDASYEIFGRSEETTTGILFKLKELESKLKVKFVFINKESPRSKCATLYFLSMKNFDFEKVLFPQTYKNFWDEVDVLITDNPKVLKKKPKNKISIKVKNDFNIDSISNYSIFDINDIKSLSNIIKQIKKTRKWKIWKKD